MSFLLFLASSLISSTLWSTILYNKTQRCVMITMKILTYYLFTALSLVFVCDSVGWYDRCGHKSWILDFFDG